MDLVGRGGVGSRVSREGRGRVSGGRRRASWERRGVGNRASREGMG